MPRVPLTQNGTRISPDGSHIFSTSQLVFSAVLRSVLTAWRTSAPEQLARAGKTRSKSLLPPGSQMRERSSQKAPALQMPRSSAHHEVGQGDRVTHEELPCAINELSASTFCAAVRSSFPTATNVGPCRLLLQSSARDRESRPARLQKKPYLPHSPSEWKPTGVRCARPNR